MLIQKNVIPLHPQKRKPLGYGVMVTLQILVLPFLVRIRVPQHKKVVKLLRNKVLSDYFFALCRHLLSKGDKYHFT